MRVPTKLFQPAWVAHTLSCMYAPRFWRRLHTSFEAAISQARDRRRPLSLGYTIMPTCGHYVS